jgi:hypothetical protein
MSYEIERERIATLSFYAAVLLLVYLMYRLLEPFFMPLAWAVVLVVLCHPWHVWLEARLGKSGAAAASTFIVTCMIVVPSLLLMTAFIQQGTLAIADPQATCRDCSAGGNGRRSTCSARSLPTWRTWSSRRRHGPPASLPRRSASCCATSSF